MKTSKSKVIFIVIAAVFAAFVAALVILVNLNSFKKRTTAVFYNVPEAQTEAIKAQLQKLSDSKGKPVNWKFIELDDEQPLAPQLKKSYDVVFTLDGLNASEAVKKIKKPAKVFPGQDLISSSTVSIKQKFQDSDGLLRKVPVCLDIYTLNLRKSVFAEDAGSLKDWEHFTSILKANSEDMETPFAVAGSSSEMIDLLAVLTESLEGSKVYAEKAEYLAGLYGTNKELPSNIEVEDIQQAFKPELELLSQWKKDRLLTNEALKFKESQLEPVMKHNQTAAVFLKLSDHRLLTPSTVQQFASIPELTDETLPYFPFVSGSGLSFTAPVTVGIALSSDKNVIPALQNLLMPSVQETICRRTGLGPVPASCRTPDIQADDVRYWIAATDRPLTPYSELCFTSWQQREHFLMVLKSCF